MNARLETDGWLTFRRMDGSIALTVTTGTTRSDQGDRIDSHTQASPEHEPNVAVVHLNVMTSAWNPFQNARSRWSLHPGTSPNKVFDSEIRELLRELKFVDVQSMPGTAFQSKLISNDRSFHKLHRFDMHGKRFENGNIDIQNVTHQILNPFSSQPLNPKAFPSMALFKTAEVGCLPSNLHIDCSLPLQDPQDDEGRCCPALPQSFVFLFRLALSPFSQQMQSPKEIFNLSSNRQTPSLVPDKKLHTRSKTRSSPKFSFPFKQKAQRYSSINSLWNFSILPTHSVPGAKNVVRKCSVPSFCPNPLPGTIQTPVASSKRMQ